MLLPRRLTVLSLGRFYPPSIGGMQTHLKQLAHGITDRVEMRILVANDCARTVRETDERGLAVTRTATWATIASASISPTLFTELRRDDSDIVHLHLPNPPAAAAYLASGHPGRLVVTYHSDIVRQRVMSAVLSPLLHRILRRAESIIVSSHACLEASEVLAPYRDRCVVIPFGVPADIGVMDRAEALQVSELRERYGKRLVVAAGRLVGYKGFSNVIRAMRDVDAHLLLVGGGPLHAPLSAQILRHGVAERVTMTGPVANLKPYLAAADVFVLPSTGRNEAFGIVQAEAMACGTPVVNTALPTGVPFVSVDRETGLTVPPADPAALAAAINELLNDDALRARLGAAARQRVATVFDYTTMIRRTRAVYDAALNASATRPAVPENESK